MLLCLGARAGASEAPIFVARLADDVPREAAARIVAGAESHRFAAEPYAAVTPSRQHGVWYRVRLAHDWGDPRPPVLKISNPQGLAVTVYEPPGYAGVERSVYRANGDDEFTRHAISIVLPDDLRAEQPVYLWVAPASSVPRRLAIIDMAQARARDIVDARLDVLFPAIQLATLLVMLSFFIVLRERMYAYFVGQMLFTVLFEFYEFGLGFEYPPLAWLAPLGIRASWLMSLLAALLSIGFTRRFLDLGRAAPRLDRSLALARWPLVAILLLVCLPAAESAGWVEDVLVLAFLLVAPMLLAAALVTWQQGGHRGGYYLCAWVPGLLLVIMRALQLGLHWPQPVWLEFALPAAFAYAGMVLAFGLADHIVSIRHERDLAHQLAEYDTLTGVLNRRAILARLRAAFVAAREQDRALAVLFLDLDHFKRVNDSYGHRAGDQCLRAVIAPIATELRQGDALGRYGGEEFLAVLPGATVANAEGVAERIRRRVEEMPMLISGMRVGLTLSIGVATLAPDVSTPEDLVERADAALYLSKSGGRNLVSTHCGPFSPAGECIGESAPRE